MCTKEDISAAVNATENTVEENTITMLDVLEQEKEMEEEYAAVLGASDEKCCTYAIGAVKRQALYSCLTCCPEARNDLAECAGICLACSYRCHESHELVELYTKRNFRCDCPTEKFTTNRCILNGSLKTPQPKNVDNSYNQNFQGVYCNCHRPYPDPERTKEELMLQCAICEDWFHLQHLNAPPEAAKLVDVCSEMICEDCMQSHKFLSSYTGHTLKSVESADDTASNVNATSDISICEDNDNKLRSDLEKSISDIMNIGGTSDDTLETKANQESGEPECKRAKIENAIKEEAATTTSNAQNKCRRPIGKTDYGKGATFWNIDWRLSLCQCADCLEMYKGQKVEFLVDPEDSAKSYEERGIKRNATESSTYEDGIRALASIGHVQQIDAITEYNRMKDKLKEYLQTFVATKKVVTEEDINRFFEQMRNEKNANLGQPHFRHTN